MERHDDNNRRLDVKPGMAQEQYDFGVNEDPPDPDTPGCIPDPGDGYQGQTVDFNAVGPLEYPFPTPKPPATKFVTSVPD